MLRKYLKKHEVKVLDEVIEDKNTPDYVRKLKWPSGLRR